MRPFAVFLVIGSPSGGAPPPKFGGDPYAMPLYGHEVIWIEVGPTFVTPQNLPQVHFTN